MQNPKRQVSGERKAVYYLGMGLTVLGFLIFLSVLISGATSFGDFNNFEARTQSMAVRAVLGIGMAIVGGILMNVGSRGLAGSGVVLDPEQSRRDLEPWSRTAGGLVRDALDEANIHLDRDPEGNRLSFDEKLRRLEQLRKEGLVTEAEYQAKRQEILKEQW